MRLTIKTWEDVLPTSGLITEFGARGEGKSALAWRLGETGHESGRTVVAFSMPEAARKLLPPWVKHVTTLTELAKLTACVVIVDEGAFKAHARRFQSDENVMWTRLIAIARHKDHLVIYITQHTRLLDVGIVTESDIVILKFPSELHERFARPELRPEISHARRCFTSKGFRGNDRRAWSYVWDTREGTKGFLFNKLPTFWSDKLSKAFSLVELDGDTPIDLAPKRRKMVHT